MGRLTTKQTHDLIKEAVPDATTVWEREQEEKYQQCQIDHDQYFSVVLLGGV
jgi:hypothetical protein